MVITLAKDRPWCLVVRGQLQADMSCPLAHICGCTTNQQMESGRYVGGRPCWKHLHVCTLWCISSWARAWPCTECEHKALEGYNKLYRVSTVQSVWHWWQQQHMSEAYPQNDCIYIYIQCLGGQLHYAAQSFHVVKMVGNMVGNMTPMIMYVWQATSHKLWLTLDDLSSTQLAVWLLSASATTCMHGRKLLWQLCT